MRRGLGWKIIVAALVSAAGVEAQSLPASCYALDPSLEPATTEPAYGPWLTDWPDSLAGTLGRSFYHISPRRADSIASRVDRWWRSDSVSLEWALASVIVDPAWTPDLAVNAAAEYRRHSGRAGPILRRGADLGNSPRTEIA